MLEFLSHRLFLWDVWAPRVIFSSLQPETIEMEDVPCSSFNNLPWTITLNSLLGLRRYHRPKTESRDLVRAGTEVSYFHMKQFLSNISFHLFLLSLLSSCHGLYCGSNCLDLHLAQSRGLPSAKVWHWAQKSFHPDSVSLWGQFKLLPEKVLHHSHHSGEIFRLRKETPEVAIRMWFFLYHFLQFRGNHSA